MKRCHITPSLLVCLGAFLTASFAGPRKAARPASILYWYYVTYNSSHPNGAVLSSADFWVEDTRSNVSSPCEPGAVRHCLRGFTYPLTSFPDASPGVDQITKP